MGREFYFCRDLRGLDPCPVRARGLGRPRHGYSAWPMADEDPGDSAKHFMEVSRNRNYNFYMHDCIF